MAGSRLLSSQIRMYVIENAQSIGESCPILKASITALTGITNGSVITTERMYIELLSASQKKGRNTLAIIASDTSPRNIDTVFARM